MTAGNVFVSVLVVFVTGALFGMFVTLAALSTPRNKPPRLKT